MHWLLLLKTKKDVTIVNAFQEVLNKSGLQPNKILVDKGSEFNYNFFKKNC